jgi:hypothetical protein
MRSLIALKAFGLSEEQSVRYYAAMMMADRGVISAPNMACGAPFVIGGAFPQIDINGMLGGRQRPNPGAAPQAKESQPS